MNYLTDQILNGIALGSIYALIALGFGVVYGVLKFLNFAHSEIFTASVYLSLFSFTFWSTYSTNTAVIILLTAVFSAIGAAGLALIVEYIAYRPLYRQPRIKMLLTAIAVSMLLQNIGIQIFGARTLGFPPISLPISPQLITLILLLITLVSTYTFFRYSDLGIRIRAVAEDPVVAEMHGIAPNQTIRAAFAIGGALAGIAGLAWGLMYSTVNPQMGYLPGMKAFMIAVIGTIGNPIGTFLIGIGLGIIEVLVVAYLPSEASGFKNSIGLGLLLTLLLLRPEGLLGAHRQEKV